MRLGILIVLVVGSWGCASVQTDGLEPEVAVGIDSNSAPATWRFDFVDKEDDPMGYMVLQFTDEKINEPTCGNDDWSLMRVLEDNLDFDFGVDSRPAYYIHGPWLTIDLTSSVCYLDHNLIGNIDTVGASGFFNVSHKIGGQNIGRFSAAPVSTATKPNSASRGN